MQLLESGEMYLETILILRKESSSVRSIDIVNYTGYSKPSVSRAVGLLKSGGFIDIDSGGYISLTDTGMEVASRIYERHVVLTGFLEKIGVSHDAAAEDACKIEHDISSETFEKLKAHSENL